MLMRVHKCFHSRKIGETIALHALTVTKTRNKLLSRSGLTSRCLEGASVR
jgi:hypothetical protein